MVDIDFIHTQLDCTYLEVLGGVEALPKWFKDLPPIVKLYENKNFEDMSVKRCTPVLDSFIGGYYLATKIDIHVKCVGDKVTFTGEGLSREDILEHPIAQLGDMPIPEGYAKWAYKWFNPFTVKTPEGYSCVFTQPFNRPESPFYTLTGVVETDNYFQPVLLPFLVKKFNGVIPKGTLIAQIIPFKREDYKSSIKIADSEYLKVQAEESMNFESNRSGKYKKEYRERKQYL